MPVHLIGGRDKNAKLHSCEQRMLLAVLRKCENKFPIEIVKNSFAGSGYFFEDTVGYRGDIESESECYSIL